MNSDLKQQVIIGVAVVACGMSLFGISAYVNKKVAKKQLTEVLANIRRAAVEANKKTTNEKRRLAFASKVTGIRVTFLITYKGDPDQANEAINALLEQLREEYKWSTEE